MEKDNFKEIILYFIWVVSLIFFLFPLGWFVYLSIKPKWIAWEFPPVWVFKPTLAHYISLLSGGTYLQSLKNSAIISTGTVILSLLVATPAAYAIARAKRKLQVVLFNWTFLVSMIPGMVFLIPYFVIFTKLNLVDTHGGLIITYTIFNLAIVVGSMSAYFSDIPREIEEVAMVDGASVTQIFVKIALPLTRPGLAAAAILCFLVSWNAFVWPLILSRSNTKPASVALTEFMRWEGIDWGSLSAGGVLLIIPGLVFAVLVRKYLVRGLTFGAVKG